MRMVTQRIIIRDIIYGNSPRANLSAFNTILTPHSFYYQEHN